MLDLMKMVVMWLFGLLFTCGVLQCWFFSSLPTELLLLAKNCGWHKHDPDFWPDHPEDATRSQWITWANMYVAEKTFPRRLVTLLTCPTCFATHVSGWVALCILMQWCPAGFNPLLLWAGVTGSWIFPAVRLTHAKS